MFENILSICEINKILKSNPDLVKNYKEKKKKSEKIKKTLEPKIAKILNDLDENKVKELLKDKINSFKLIKSFCEENDKATYYENCKLISKEILDVLKKLIDSTDEIEVNYIFDNKEIIILMNNENIINIGNIENNNDLKI